MADQRDHPMMKCGCVATAHAGHGESRRPVCATHYGLTPDAEVIVPTPDLTGRQSECAYCGKQTPSSPALPFFAHRPDKPTDLHYDGCRGWD